MRHPCAKHFDSTGTGFDLLAKGFHKWTGVVGLRKEERLRNGDHRDHGEELRSMPRGYARLRRLGSLVQKHALRLSGPKLLL